MHMNLVTDWFNVLYACLPTYKIHYFQFAFFSFVCQTVLCLRWCQSVLSSLLAFILMDSEGFKEPRMVTRETIFGVQPRGATKHVHQVNASIPENLPQLSNNASEIAVAHKLPPTPGSETRRSNYHAYPKHPERNTSKDPDLQPLDPTTVLPNRADTSHFRIENQSPLLLDTTNTKKLTESYEQPKPLQSDNNAAFPRKENDLEFFGLDADTEPDYAEITRTDKYLGDWIRFYQYKMLKYYVMSDIRNKNNLKLGSLNDYIRDLSVRIKDLEKQLKDTKTHSQTIAEQLAQSPRTLVDDHENRIKFNEFMKTNSSAPN
ncbi:hypothetical protein V1512DRAFT_273394 [Lipomyces arxii]|uniref:uncharacterized protein n=1 Tax=Lipomyces arxii TaxID=56418 RepID=UPI0034CEF172